MRGNSNTSQAHLISDKRLTEAEWIKQTGATVIDGEATEVALQRNRQLNTGAASSCKELALQALTRLRAINRSRSCKRSPATSLAYCNPIASVHLETSVLADGVGTPRVGPLFGQCAPTQRSAASERGLRPRRSGCITIILATALANKLARIAWTVLAQRRNYETRVVTQAA
jgi:hypothetical protein